MADVADVRLSAKDNFSTVMGKMLRAMDSIIGKHTALAASAIATGAVIKGSISVYADFEEQLAKVNTMLSDGESRFLPGYKKAIKELAASSGQATETLSDGLYDILSASRGAEDAVAILSATTSAAIGGFTDVATATSSALTTLNAFKLENEDVNRILDLQFATVKRGRLTYEQYAQNIGQLAATSSLAGQSMESMNAAVATVTRGGISAERAITQINRAILTFIKPSTEAAAAAKEYGIELGINAVQGDNLGKTLAKLKELDAEQLAQIFRDIRGYKAISILTQNYEGFLRDLGEQYDSTGRAAEATEKATNTLNVQLARSAEIFKNLGESIGGVFAPALRDALRAINDAIQGTIKLNQAPEIWLQRQIDILETFRETRGLTKEEIILLGQLKPKLPHKKSWTMKRL
jgi:TP901 family phage tail tape measure protein